MQHLSSVRWRPVQGMHLICRTVEVHLFKRSLYCSSASCFLEKLLVDLYLLQPAQQSLCSYSE